MKNNYLIFIKKQIFIFSFFGIAYSDTITINPVEDTYADSISLMVNNGALTAMTIVNCPTYYLYSFIKFLCL